MKTQKRNILPQSVLGVALVLNLVCAIAAGQDKTAKPSPTPSRSPSPASESTPRYRNPNLAIDDRVADLLSRMTLEEKVEQITGGSRAETQVIDPTGTYTTESARAVLLRWWDPDQPFPPRKAAILRNGVQRYLHEKTRLGIPALFMGEALHGLMEYGSTSFPAGAQPRQHLGSGTGSSGLHCRRRRSRVAPAQVRSSLPCSTLRAIRAGDARRRPTAKIRYLVSRIGVAAIEGLQGDSFLIDHHHVWQRPSISPCTGSRRAGPTPRPATTPSASFARTSWCHFRPLSRKRDVGSVMASYNEIDGIPSHINPWLLGRVLRQEWGFRGYVTSDGDGLQMLVETHHVAANNAEAARLALAAGVDYDLSDGSVYRTLLWQVKQGAVPES